jgi:hypothetical protein
MTAVETELLEPKSRLVDNFVELSQEVAMDNGLKSNAQNHLLVAKLD